MPILTGLSQYAELGAYQTEANQSSIPLGQLQPGQGGLLFRYVKAGGSNLVKGNLVQSPALGTGFVDMAVQAAVTAPGTFSNQFGGYVIPVTLGGTSTTSTTQFQGGKLCVTVTPGIGQTFTILGNDVATNGTTCNFYVQEPVQTSLTTSSKVTATLNLWNGVIQAPTTLTGVPVGVVVSAIPSGSYGWIQSHGECSTLIQSTPALGAAVMPSGTTAGAVTTQTAGNVIIGTMMALGVNGENQPVFLNID